MSQGSRVFIIDDQAGDIGSLIRRITKLGYEIDLATNEQDAQEGLRQVAEDPQSYAAGIFDIMAAVVDLETLLEMGDDVDLQKKVFEDPIDTGVRLCRYARQTLGLDAEAFPIAALSVREDSELKQALDELGVPLYRRAVEDASEHSIMRFVDRYLPRRDDPDAGSA